MANARPAIIASFLVFALSAVACAPRGAAPLGEGLPPNVGAFSQPIPVVWDAVLNLLRADDLIPIEVADAERGYFSSEEIKEDLGGIVSRYRISGTLTSDGVNTLLTLYKQHQLYENAQWRTIPSDLRLEQNILTRLRKRLQP